MMKHHCSGFFWDAGLTVVTESEAIIMVGSAHLHVGSDMVFGQALVVCVFQCVYVDPIAAGFDDFDGVLVVVDILDIEDDLLSLWRWVLEVCGHVEYVVDVDFRFAAPRLQICDKLDGIAGKCEFSVCAGLVTFVQCAEISAAPASLCGPATAVGDLGIGVIDGGFQLCAGCCGGIFVTVCGVAAGVISADAIGIGG